MTPPTQLRIVSFSPYVPHEGIGHAGGELLRWYFRLTAGMGTRTLVSPVEADIGMLPEDVDEVLFVGSHGTTLTRLPAAAWARLGVEWFTWPQSRESRGGLRADPRVVSALRAADVVEYHWQEATAAMAWAQTVAPNARHIVYVHDVISQRLRRAAAVNAGWTAGRDRLIARVTQRRERAMGQRADAVLVLSDKDARLLPTATDVVVAPPIIDLPLRSSTQLERQGSPTFAFVGTFHRVENAEAASWLLEQVWPQVRQECPGARLNLVGAGSDRFLARRGRGDVGVHASGYVENLADAYASTTAALVPLRRGAGVKIKTLEALATGTPCVSTSVGAEGIDRAAEFIQICDEPDAFAAAAIAVCTEPRRNAARARLGAEWVRQTCSPAAIAPLYERFVMGRPSETGAAQVLHRKRSSRAL